MSLFDRRKLLLALAALPVAACGFQPVLRQGGAARGLMGQIKFNLIESREGFVLLQQLESRLGNPALGARFDAEVELEIEEVGMVLTAATEVTRFEVNGKVTITVTDTATGEAVFTDKLRDTTGFTENSETAASNAARRDARERLVLALADQIVMRLTSTAESWAG